MKDISLKENYWIIRKTAKKTAKPEQIIDSLLSQRGVRTRKQKTNYFDPPKPEDISLGEFGLQKARINAFTKRIEKAIKRKEKVVIYGDYDADGICATAILWEVLYGIGTDAHPFIPSRFREGYGLNKRGFERMQKDFGPDLIITVDNGIVSFEAVELAKQSGVDVIITDHHQKSKKVPAVELIIHTTKTSGAGISYLLANHLRNVFKKPDKRKGLGLCAIGIVSDQVSMKHPNRSLVKFGLDRLSDTKRPGLKAIFDQAGKKETKKSVYDIGFVIAPRINAAGRLDNAMDSLRLLCTPNRPRSKDLATVLGTHNRRRQEIVSDVLIEAEKIAEKKKWKGAVMVASKNFHEGVIGLAASRLVEKFNRPAIVFSVGDKETKASGRSIEGFDLITQIRKMKKYLVAAGGHPGAAGFSIKTSDLNKFTKEFEILSVKVLGQKPIRKTLKIDLEIELKQINNYLLHDLMKFEPTGVDSRKPIFVTKGVEIVSYKLVGSDQKHLKLILRKDEKTFDAIAFGFGKYFREITRSDYIDVAYYVEENIWNGVSSIDLRVVDICN
ncbi:single-stranded-DNA-specific exonuclease RecJ [Patescibacteria group bacterium]